MVRGTLYIQHTYMFFDYVEAIYLRTLDISESTISSIKTDIQHNTEYVRSVHIIRWLVCSCDDAWKVGGALQFADIYFKKAILKLGAQVEAVFVYYFISFMYGAVVCSRQSLYIQYMRYELSDTQYHKLNTHTHIATDTIHLPFLRTTSLYVDVSIVGTRELSYSNIALNW